MPQTSHSSEEKELAYDIKFLLIVLLLFIFYPVGLILMWVWMAWPKWLKLLISLPVLLFLFMVFIGFFFFVRVWRNSDMMWQSGQPMRGYYYMYQQQPRGYRMPMIPYYPSTTQPTAGPTANPGNTY